MSCRLPDTFVRGGALPRGEIFFQFPIISHLNNNIPSVTSPELVFCHFENVLILTGRPGGPSFSEAFLIWYLQDYKYSISGQASSIKRQMGT
jgi:hypothetical protein